MKKAILFAANFLLASLFLADIMDYYFITGINIISNEVNRPFIMWLGLLTSLFSCLIFLIESTKKCTQ